MRKLLTLLLIGAFALSAAPVYAAARHGLTPSDAIETDTSAVLPAGSWLYKAVLFADAASSFAGIHDAATTNVTGATTVVDEIGEATQYDRAEVTYDPPVYLTNGASVIMTTGTLILFTGPGPSSN